jgi:bifunctional DNA-binding transcriptional regulator/antitoxin component of YhaV-PrlF toxin-antitoxin module
MQSTITSKFQTTIPKTIRQSLALSVNDTLEWKFDHGKAIVSPLQKNFLKYRNSVKVGKGDIEADIGLARDLRLEDYR